MGGCIKALLAGSRREELEFEPFHASSRHRSHYPSSGVASSVATPTTFSWREKSTATDSMRGKPHSITLSAINSANYHQLSVLAKISADQAKKVINYRVNECGGKFSSIEQLLEIPGGGITPEKLQSAGISQRLDPVILSKATMALSSDAQWSDTYTCSHEHKRNQPTEHDREVLDIVNLANYHQLCILARINTHQAEIIINYRVYKCGFRSVQQLLDVPKGGITPEKLKWIRSYITQCHSPGLVHYKSPRTKCRSIHKSPNEMVFDLSNIGVLHIGEDSSTPPRTTPSSGENFIRIASWNLECFTTCKASNLGVLEVVCMTLLMNGLDIIAFQELGDAAAIKKVCEELNHPTLARVEGWPARRGKWKCAVSEKTGRMFQGMEYNAFLWNESRGICFKQCGLLGKGNISDDQFFVRKPFIGVFKVANWSFVLISVHLKAAGWSGEHTEKVINEIKLLTPLVQATVDEVNGKKDVLLLGDFNMSSDNSSFGPLLEASYTPIFPANEPTNISVVNLKGNHSYDNIWITTKLCSERYTGQYKIVRRGLQHQLIEGKKPGTTGTVSNHCPIWAAFSTRGKQDK